MGASRRQGGSRGLASCPRAAAYRRQAAASPSSELRSVRLDEKGRTKRNPARSAAAALREAGCGAVPGDSMDGILDPAPAAHERREHVHGLLDAGERAPLVRLVREPGLAGPQD